MKVLIFDPVMGETITEKEIPSLTVVDGMYVKELGLCPLAYVYHAKHKEKLEEILKDLTKRRKEFKDYEANIWYRILPQYRADK